MGDGGRIVVGLFGLMLAAFGAGCGGAEDGSLSLRPGFRVLYESKIPPLEATSGWGHRGQAFVVTDVSATRERLVISGLDVTAQWTPTVHVDSFDPYTVTGGSGVDSSVNLHTAFVSEDHAATWRAVALEPADPSLSVQPLGFGLAEAGGHAVVAFRASPTGHQQVYLGDLDLATGIFTAIDVVMPDGQWNRYGNRVGAAYDDQSGQTW
jgi:hypothetical protein